MDDQTPNGFGKLIVSRSVFSVAHPMLSLLRGAVRALAPCGQGSFLIQRWLINPCQVVVRTCGDGFPAIIMSLLLQSGRSPGTSPSGASSVSDPNSTKLMLTTRFRFIEPQLASSVEKPPEGKHWIHERCFSENMHENQWSDWSLLLPLPWPPQRRLRLCHPCRCIRRTA